MTVIGAFIVLEQSLRPAAMSAKQQAFEKMDAT
jgi:hypothetical protein